MPWEWKDNDKSKKGSRSEKRSRCTELDMYPWVCTKKSGRAEKRSESDTRFREEWDPGGDNRRTRQQYDQPLPHTQHHRTEHTHPQPHRPHPSQSQPSSQSQSQPSSQSHTDPSQSQPSSQSCHDDADAKDVYQTALHFKTRGNDKVRDQDCNGAIALYETGIETLTAGDGPPRRQTSEDSRLLEATLYGNIAQCLLNLQLAGFCVEAATKCLALDDENVKALYRRSAAHEALKQWTLALKDTLALQRLGGGGLSEQTLERRIMHLRTKICYGGQERGVDYDGSYPYETYLNYFFNQAGEDLLPIPFNDTNPETGRADKRSRFEPTRTDDHTPPSPPPPPSPHRTEHIQPQSSPKTGRADTRSRHTEFEPSRTDEPSQTGAPDPQKEYRSLTKKLAQIDKLKLKAVLNPDEAHELALEDVLKGELMGLVRVQHSFELEFVDLG